METFAGAVADSLPAPRPAPRRAARHAAGYYYAPSTSPASANLWVVYLGARSAPPQPKKPNPHPKTRAPRLTRPKPSLFPFLSLSAEGKDWCYDARSCAARAALRPDVMSSKWWAAKRVVGGLFSPLTTKNPGFATANKVIVPYCSSDAWVGDVGASDDTFGYEFRGQRIMCVVCVRFFAMRHAALLCGIFCVLAPRR
jgi:hypothetical protein